MYCVVKLGSQYRTLFTVHLQPVQCSAVYCSVHLKLGCQYSTGVHCTSLYSVLYCTPPAGVPVQYRCTQYITVQCIGVYTSSWGHNWALHPRHNWLDTGHWERYGPDTPEPKLMALYITLEFRRYILKKKKCLLCSLSQIKSFKSHLKLQSFLAIQVCGTWQNF